MEDVRSIGNFSFVNHQGLPLSPASTFFLLCNQLQLPVQWGLKPSAQPLVPPQLWMQGYRQISLLLLVFLFLWESQEAVGRSLHDSINDLTEKYSCLNLMCRGTTRTGEGKAALSKEKDSSFQARACGQSSWAGTRHCQAQTRFVHWYPRDCVFLGYALCQMPLIIACISSLRDVSHMDLVLNNLWSLGFDHTAQNSPYPTRTYWNR